MVGGGRPNLVLAPGSGHRVYKSQSKPERAWARAWPEPELDKRLISCLFGSDWSGVQILSLNCHTESKSNRQHKYLFPHRFRPPPTWHLQPDLPSYQVTEAASKPPHWHWRSGSTIIHAVGLRRPCSCWPTLRHCKDPAHSPCVPCPACSASEGPWVRLQSHWPRC